MTITEEAALPEPVGLISSGIETLSAGWGGYLKAVVAEDGAIWALAEGRLVRYDPVVGAAETWSIDDDERFFATDVLPAGAGGVWLLSDRMVRRFDGAGFRQAIDVGAYVNAATEAPDGTLWAATADGEIVHVTGERRIRIDALPPTSGGFISAMAVDAAGGVWCGWQRPWGWGDGVAWVSRYDGAWRVMDRRDIARPGSFVRAIAAPSDGSVWVVTDSRLVRFEGSTREDYGPGEPLRGDSPVAVAVGAEGALWVDLGNRIGRFAGRSWELVAWVAIPEEGVTSILPTRDAVFVAAGGSIYRHVSDGWCAAWSSNAPAGPAPTPMFPTHIVAVSRDEAWVADTAIWRVTGGAWSPAAQGAGGAVRALLRTPDGTLWWTVEDGSLYVLRGTRAEKLASGSLRGLAADAAGLVWVADGPVSGPDGAPPGSRECSVRSFGRVGGAWSERGRTPSTALVAWPGLVAIGRGGTVWLGSPGGDIVRAGVDPAAAGLARLVSGRWEPVDAGRVYEAGMIADMMTAPNGDLWVSASDASTADSWIGRFDGGRWTIFGADDGLILDYGTALAAAPDGSIWAATAGGLARFDGAHWSVRYPGMRFSAISIAPDGTVWVTGPTGIERLPGPHRP